MIGQSRLRHLDPFVLLDRFDSDDPDAFMRGFPSHPHRGFETVTVMLEGEVRHQDSRGNAGLIVAGGSQWMTAGRGIIHSEMPQRSLGRVSGYQLWVNLPARDKLSPQHYQDLQPRQLTEVVLSPSQSKLRVIVGTVHGTTGPARNTPVHPTALTLLLQDERPVEWETPRNHTAIIAVHSGVLEVGPETSPVLVTANSLAVLAAGTHVRVRARAPNTGALFAAAAAIGEPIVQRGPFVMNTDAEIEQAFRDYREGVLDRS
jgi:redox-sensitive bicupin YhaK (pirin superfamily)